MLYKTILLELLQDRPAFYEELRRSKRLLPSMETYAAELRESHLRIQASLARRMPGDDLRQVASEALELAIEALTSRLPCEPGSPDA